MRSVKGLRERTQKFQFCDGLHEILMVYMKCDYFERVTTSKNENT